MEDHLFDKVFKEKMEAFTPPPPPDAFNKIKAQMAANKARNRMIIFWRLAAAAVFLGFAFLAGQLFIMERNTTSKQTIAESQIQNEQINEFEETQQKDFYEKNIESAYRPIEKLEIKIPESRTKLAGFISNQSDRTQKDVYSIEERTSEKLNYLRAKLIRFIPSDNLNEPLNLSTIKKDNRNDYLSDTEKELIAMNAASDSRNREIENNWKLGVQLSPGYSSYTSDYSGSYSQNMLASSSDGNADMGAGLSVEYKTSKKWSIQSGLYYTSNGQKSQGSDGIFSRNQEYAYAPASGGEYYETALDYAVSANTLAMNSTAGVIELEATPSNAEVLSNFEKTSTTDNSLVAQSDFSQVFNFVEIPLYLRYQVIESRIGVQLLGGVNANFIVGNNVYMDGENVGKTADISSFNYSGTLGVGVEYALGKHISLSVEPRFNYYLSSINKRSDVEFRPYRIGVYTGVSYEF